MSDIAATSPAAGDNDRLTAFMDGVKRRNPGEPEYHAAVHEVAQSVLPFIARHPEYEELRILERLTEPDRVVSFRV